ncbi:DUF1145 domain-containing protein [Ralstonia sp. ASV6]|uniref:DUF1145 domain-containing protein n=1 Tax=Ralstonia sp. ASV6 TaxID=2795124 RepID=UPI0018EAE193|nr:DUF1145 domain-containing protein [Ralstonia sp. ASV6]
MLPRPDPVLGGGLVLYFFNKLLLLAVYGVALGSYAMPLPLSADVIYWVRIVAVVLLAAHLLEVVFCFRKVALHKGPLFDSVLLTMLFGFLHWKPMADAARNTR